MKVSKSSLIHKRMKCFVEFIAPEKDKAENIKRQADDIRECIARHAKEEGYVIAANPYSGSFSKKSGLRRQMQGNDEVEGQDIDIGFILEDKDKSGDPLKCMIIPFKRYLQKCYPDSEVGHTKSSATISFKSTKLQFDVVPLIKTGKENIQKLIRTNGEVRQSSVQKQTEFMKGRNRSSNDIDGVVRFNDCLRLVKWWRYQKQTESHVFGNNSVDKKVPSFLLDLLCAKAYDEVSVKDTYPETLARWFSFLASMLKNRNEILFSDFIIRHQKREEAKWKVIDPMDDTNNVVRNWPDYQINEFADWFEKGRDQLNQAIRYDKEGDEENSLNVLVDLFGNSIKNHCKKIS